MVSADSRLFSKRLSRLLRLAPFALLLGCLAAPGNAQTVFSQPAVFPASSSFFAWTSSSNTPYVTSDNFTLANVTSLTGVTWQGFTFINNVGTAGVEPATFNVEFRADNGGVPGTVLDNELVSPGKSVAGTSNFFGAGPINIYNYTAALSGTFKAAANTPLWVSIIGNPTGQSFWTWTQGTGGNGSCYQEVSTGGSTSQSGDRAFSLSGAPVPEASTTVSFGLLLALGLGGLVVAAKRKRAAQSH